MPSTSDKMNEMDLDCGIQFMKNLTYMVRLRRLVFYNRAVAILGESSLSSIEVHNTRNLLTIAWIGKLKWRSLANRRTSQNKCKPKCSNSRFKMGDLTIENRIRYSVKSTRRG